MLEPLTVLIIAFIMMLFAALARKWDWIGFLGMIAALAALTYIYRLLGGV